MLATLLHIFVLGLVISTLGNNHFQGIVTMPPHSRTRLFERWHRNDSDCEDDHCAWAVPLPPHSAVTPETAREPGEETLVTLPADPCAAHVLPIEQDSQMPEALPTTAAVPVLQVAPPPIDARVRAAVLQAATRSLSQLQRVAAVSSRLLETDWDHEQALRRQRESIEAALLGLVGHLADGDGDALLVEPSCCAAVEATVSGFVLQFVIV
jgi:hypothetical protein